MKIGDRIDSDHQPVEVWMKGDKRKNTIKKRRKENKRMWNEGRERIFQGEISL